MLQSAIATRRVGDIRQRLGQTAHAEREYLKAISQQNYWGSESWLKASSYDQIDSLSMLTIS